MQVEYKYTVEDIAEMLTVSTETVRRWCRNKQINHIKLPGRKGGFRFSKNDIVDFVAKLNSNPYDKGGTQGSENST
ncbi:MAG: helix-turn-helix domain-containing protein [Candidatus Pacebacteria bacterium]|nr:helix-turn-helix domain-containing protein [Candidatus Paceibacterota bacterium]